MGFTKKQRREQRRQQFHQNTQAKRAPAHKVAQKTKKRRDQDNLVASHEPDSAGRNAIEHNAEANPTL